jgi:hypothetical protein
MDYDRYWLDVPRIKPQHLRGFSLEQAMERSPKDIGGYFERVYGYPKIHVDYLLDNRVARSAPDSHPGALVTSKRLPLASFNEFMSLTGGVVDFKSQNGRRFKVLSIEGEVMYYEKLDSKVEVVWKLNLSEVYRAYIEFDDFKLVNFKKILPLTYSAAKALLIHIGFLKDGI